MTMPRYAAKRDTSEREIVSTLRDLGFSVWIMDTPVDLLLGWRGDIFLAECKTGKAKLNKNQQDFVATWKGRPVVKLTSSQDAIDWVISISEKKGK